MVSYCTLLVAACMLTCFSGLLAYCTSMYNPSMSPLDKTAIDDTIAPQLSLPGLRRSPITHPLPVFKPPCFRESLLPATLYPHITI